MQIDSPIRSYTKTTALTMGETKRMHADGRIFRSRDGQMKVSNHHHQGFIHPRSIFENRLLRWGIEWFPAVLRVVCNIVMNLRFTKYRMRKFFDLALETLQTLAVYGFKTQFIP